MLNSVFSISGYVDVVMTHNENHLQPYEVTYDSLISLDTNERIKMSQHFHISVDGTVGLTNASLSFGESTIGEKCEL